MTQIFTLQQVGIVLGLYLVIAYGLAAFRPDTYWNWLPRFPRSMVWGYVLTVIAMVWGGWLISTVSLGEFAPLRNIFFFSAIVLCLLTAVFVPEFLAVRMSGILALLLAEPVLVAAYMRPETTRLLVVVLAYGWIVCGLFFVGLPWLLRDWLTWGMASRARFRAIGLSGFLYGIAILVCAVFIW